MRIRSKAGFRYVLMGRPRDASGVSQGHLEGYSRGEDLLSLVRSRQVRLYGFKTLAKR